MGFSSCGLGGVVVLLCVLWVGGWVFVCGYLRREGSVVL